MHISLVYAGIAGKGFASIGQGMDSGWISHGLAILGAVLKREGHEVDLLDLRALRGWDHLREEVLRRRPDVCGLTMMSVDFNPVMQAAEVIKAALPACTVVVGGPHPTLATDEVLPFSAIDYIVTQEGELALPRLLRDLERGNKPPRVIVGEHPDLDSLPYADHDLFLDEWRRWGYAIDSPEAPFVPELPPPFVTVIAGRGCIYNCAFCKPGEALIFGNRVRRRGVANVIGELAELRDKYHFRSFMFHDDCLTENPRWVREFCQAYRERGFTQPFFCQSRADIIVKHEETVALMAQAGLKGYFIGFESGNDRVLEFIGKGTTRAENIEAARICRKYGISVWANYMLGLPTETQEEIRDTISMLRQIDPDYYSPAFFTPHPGSHLYDYCEQNGLSLVMDHDDYARNPNAAKIKGHDPAFLQWALMASQKRTAGNSVKRRVRYLWGRYAQPRKVLARARRLLSAASAA
ncbi:MAG: B12-binding domain-containing radical SAM protein [Anaerolineae bacterium]